MTENTFPRKSTHVEFHKMQEQRFNKIVSKELVETAEVWRAGVETLTLIHMVYKTSMPYK